MNETSRHATGVAIEIMTALFSDPSSTAFALERLQAIKDEDGIPGYSAAVAGLLNLAAAAISELSRQSGVPELELLQRFALTVQGGSTQLSGSRQARALPGCPCAAGLSCSGVLLHRSPRSRSATSISLRRPSVLVARTTSGGLVMGLRAYTRPTSAAGHARQPGKSLSTSASSRA
jgi:hypothetical protein